MSAADPSAERRLGCWHIAQEQPALVCEGGSPFGELLTTAKRFAHGFRFRERGPRRGSSD